MPSMELVRKLDILDPALKEVLYSFIEEIEKNREQAVSKVEFNELKEIVRNLAVTMGELGIAQRELAEAQKRTEIEVKEIKVDLNELKGIVKELAEAQKRTEIKVEELAEAQKRTEIKVEELAEAQKRTEIKVEELAEAQKRTEIKVEELAEAQKRTEIKVEELVEVTKELAKDQKQIRSNLGGLSITVGYRLEDLSYKGLPELLKRDFEITLQERLKRKYVTDNEGSQIEVNIVGKAHKDGKDIMIIGESKSQLSKNDINYFIRKKLDRLKGIYQEIFPVLITYMISEPDVEDYAKAKGISLYYSYDFNGM
jgi:myosin heavy subunit